MMVALATVWEATLPVGGIAVDMFQVSLTSVWVKSAPVLKKNSNRFMAALKLPEELGVSTPNR